MANRATVEQAALNNAAWCALICATHDAPGTFDAATWSTLGSTPPYYPNMVTLAATAEAEQLRRVRLIVAALGRTHEVGIKDSFSRLDLSGLGFAPRIRAEWHALTGPIAGDGAEEVETVRDDETLLDWERAWSTTSPSTRRMFTPGLLDREDVLFLAGRTDGRVTAGIIANLSAGAVGISNLFAPPGHGAAFVASALCVIRESFGDLPIIGYWGGADDRLMARLGFEPLGPVTIWIRPADST